MGDGCEEWELTRGAFFLSLFLSSVPGLSSSVSSKAKLSSAIKSGTINKIEEADPTLFACAYKKNR